MLELEIDFTNKTDLDISDKIFRDHLSLILQRLKTVGTVGIEIMLLLDQEIQELNREHLGANYATDVLSFPSGADTGAQKFLGSIAISTETAKRQATAAGTDVSTELRLLSGHGLLHLLGYHHE